MSFRVEKYCVEHKMLWDNFVSESKNGTFLFYRDFMEYHSDRFQDFSMMVFDDAKLIAILPANIVDNILHSHQGLTYGGLVYKDRLKLKEVVSCFESILLYLNHLKIDQIIIKTIPPIYHKSPSEEFLYALFIANANLYKRDSLAVIDLKQPYFISKTRKESIRRGQKNALIVIEESNFKPFWNDVLIPNMQNRHAAKPIHSLEEIVYLQSKFPNNIKHFNVYLDNKVVAGTTIFVSKKVAHAQHISALDNRNELGSLDFLYHHLLTNVFKNIDYFDFGISNEADGRKLKEQLIFWKESFGTNVIVQDFYKIDTANYTHLKNYLV